jgi:geranylgeranyl diphosphate synthase, type III
MSAVPSITPSSPPPAAIPPRTSSTGQYTGSSSAHPTLGHSRTGSGPSSSNPPAIASGALAPSALAPSPATASSSKAVAESDWLAQRQQPHHQHYHHSRNGSTSHATVSRKASIASNSLLAIMQKPPPPPDPQRYAHEDFNFTRRKTWSDEKETVLRGPFDYLMASPGKDFRTQLIRAFDAWLEVPPESLEVITRVVGMLHTASLLIDDVEDMSSLRRGLPVAHKIFGVPQTINSANYIYFCALQELQKLKNQKVITIFAEELVHLHRGQGMDLFWRDTLTVPTEDDYLEMVANKTGGLFRLGIKLMQAESRSLTDCVTLVNLAGLIFQIRDDYMNLQSTEYSSNKGLCEDLTEGKFSFPIIHAIRADLSNMQLLNILRQKTDDIEMKQYAVKYMEGTGSFEYTKQVVAVLIERARRVAEEIDDGRGKVQGVLQILDKMMI